MLLYRTTQNITQRNKNLSCISETLPRICFSRSFCRAATIVLRCRAARASDFAATEFVISIVAPLFHIVHRIQAKKALQRETRWCVGKSRCLPYNRTCETACGTFLVFVFFFRSLTDSEPVCALNCATMAFLGAPCVCRVPNLREMYLQKHPTRTVGTHQTCYWCQYHP